MASFVQRGADLLREAALRLSVRRDAAAIDTVAAMGAFVRTRASFVAQHKLYGYLKTRMGAGYPAMFEDDGFVRSVSIAREHVFAACLSDLTVHCVANGLRGVRADDALKHLVAMDLHRHGMEEAGLSATSASDRSGWIDAFGHRIGDLRWDDVDAGAGCFTQSPASLARWAPVAAELKEADRAILENSMRYAWNGIIRDFRRYGVPSALAADALDRYGAGAIE